MCVCVCVGGGGGGCVWSLFCYAVLSVFSSFSVERAGYFGCVLLSCGC